MSVDEKPPRQKREPRKPRPVTASYLQKSAMHYLAARAASTQMLRDTLTRRAKRRLCVNRLEAETLEAIERTIAGLAGQGLVDDRRFASVRTRSLAGRGLPARNITQRLRLKGIDATTAATAIAHEVPDEVAQARRYVERRRLGPWRRGAQTDDTRHKDLAALGRAGFSYAVAKAALSADE
jgi:regulatory protein